ncbi:MAG: hypothetical protein V1742_00510 [Pseudomonadota bacterium]
MTSPTLTDMDKLAHLLEHWQEHNNDHAANYRSWADKAEESGKTEASGLLRQAANVTDQVTEIFTRAAEALSKK